MLQQQPQQLPGKLPRPNRQILQTARRIQRTTTPTTTVKATSRATTTKATSKASVTTTKTATRTDAPSPSSDPLLSPNHWHSHHSHKNQEVKNQGNNDDQNRGNKKMMNGKPRKLSAYHLLVGDYDENQDPQQSPATIRPLPPPRNQKEQESQRQLQRQQQTERQLKQEQEEQEHQNADTANPNSPSIPRQYPTWQRAAAGLHQMRHDYVEQLLGQDYGNDDNNPINHSQTLNEDEYFDVVKSRLLAGTKHHGHGKRKTTQSLRPRMAREEFSYEDDELEEVLEEENDPEPMLSFPTTTTVASLQQPTRVEPQNLAIFADSSSEGDEDDPIMTLQTIHEADEEEQASQFTSSTRNSHHVELLRQMTPSPVRADTNKHQTEGHGEDPNRRMAPIPIATPSPVAAMPSNNNNARTTQTTPSPTISNQGVSDANATTTANTISPPPQQTTTATTKRLIQVMRQQELQKSQEKDQRAKAQAAQELSASTATSTTATKKNTTNSNKPEVSRTKKKPPSPSLPAPRRYHRKDAQGQVLAETPTKASNSMIEEQDASPSHLKMMMDGENPLMTLSKKVYGATKLREHLDVKKSFERLLRTTQEQKQTELTVSTPPPKPVTPSPTKSAISKVSPRKSKQSPSQSPKLRKAHSKRRKSSAKFKHHQLLSYLSKRELDALNDLTFNALLSWSTKNNTGSHSPTIPNSIQIKTDLNESGMTSIGGGGGGGGVSRITDDLPINFCAMMMELDEYEVPRDEDNEERGRGRPKRMLIEDGMEDYDEEFDDFMSRADISRSFHTKQSPFLTSPATESIAHRRGRKSLLDSADSTKASLRLSLSPVKTTLVPSMTTSPLLKKDASGVEVSIDVAKDPNAPQAQSQVQRSIMLSNKGKPEQVKNKVVISRPASPPKMETPAVHDVVDDVSESSQNVSKAESQSQWSVFGRNRKGRFSNKDPRPTATSSAQPATATMPRDESETTVGDVSETLSQEHISKAESHSQWMVFSRNRRGLLLKKSPNKAKASTKDRKPVAAAQPKAAPEAATEIVRAEDNLLVEAQDANTVPRQGSVPVDLDEIVRTTSRQEPSSQGKPPYVKKRVAVGKKEVSFSVSLHENNVQRAGSGPGGVGETTHCGAESKTKSQMKEEATVTKKGVSFSDDVLHGKHCPPPRNNQSGPVDLDDTIDTTESMKDLSFLCKSGTPANPGTEENNSSAILFADTTDSGAESNTKSPVKQESPMTKKGVSFSDVLHEKNSPTSRNNKSGPVDLDDTIDTTESMKDLSFLCKSGTMADPGTTENNTLTIVKENQKPPTAPKERSSLQKNSTKSAVDSNGVAFLVETTQAQRNNLQTDSGHKNPATSEKSGLRVSINTIRHQETEVTLGQFTDETFDSEADQQQESIGDIKQNPWVWHADFYVENDSSNVRRTFRLDTRYHTLTLVASASMSDPKQIVGRQKRWKVHGARALVLAPSQTRALVLDLSPLPSNAYSKKTSKNERCEIILLPCQQFVPVLWLDAIHLMLEAGSQARTRNGAGGFKALLDGYINLVHVRNQQLQQDATDDSDEQNSSFVSQSFVSESGLSATAMAKTRYSTVNRAPMSSGNQPTDQQLEVLQDSWTFYKRICSSVQYRHRYHHAFHSMQQNDPVYPYLSSLTGMADNGLDSTCYETEDKEISQPKRQRYKRMSRDQVAQALVHEAETVLPKLTRVCEYLSSGDLGLVQDARIGPIKTVHASLKKADKKYKGDILQVTDFCRASIIVQDFASLLALLEWVRAGTAHSRVGKYLCRVKLSTLQSNPKVGGYRDCIINLELPVEPSKDSKGTNVRSKHICEIQVHLWPLWVIGGMSGFERYHDCLKYSTNSSTNAFHSLNPLDRATLRAMTVIAEQDLSSQTPLQKLSWHEEVTVSTYFALAGLFLKSGRAVWAEGIFRRLIELHLEAPMLGPGHPETLFLYHCLLQTLMSQKKNKQEQREIQERIKLYSANKPWESDPATSAVDMSDKENHAGKGGLMSWEDLWDDLLNAPNNAYYTIVDPAHDEREAEEETRLHVKESKRAWRNIRKERFAFLTQGHRGAADYASM